MAVHQALPGEGVGAEAVNLVLQVPAQAAGEGLVKEGVTGETFAAHALVAAVDAGDATRVVLAHQHSLGSVVQVNGGVEGAVLVGVEGVVREIGVAGADIGVVQLVCHGVEGADAVLAGAGGHVQGDAVLLLQEEILLLHRAYHHMDVLDAHLLQLEDEPLNEGLAIFPIQPLGHGVEGAGRPVGTFRRQQDGVFHPIGFQLLEGELGHGQVIQIALLLQLSQDGQGLFGGVKDRIVQVLLQVGQERTVGVALESGQVVEDFKFFIGYHETCLLYLYLAGKRGRYQSFRFWIFS